MRRPRLCRRYCNAIRAAGGAGPLCPHCDACETAMLVWDRVFGDELEWRPRLALDEDLDTLVQRGDELPGAYACDDELSEDGRRHGGGQC